MLRAGLRPRLGGIVLLLEFPLSVALVASSTPALGVRPVMFAWGVIEWSLWRRNGTWPSRAAVAAADVAAQAARRTR